MKTCFYFALLLIALSAHLSPAEDRHALVIGNSKYEGEAALRNPANDADAMEVTLKKLNFKVNKLNEADIDQMEKGVAAFRKSLKKGDVALFFYAGHGLQVKGENFLVPLKASPDDESEVKRKCYAVDNVLEAMESSDSYIKIVILDCCRNNPFKRGWSRSRSEKGMSAIAEIPNGTVIAFATAPGALAADGKGANSPYTTHLVASLNSRPKEGLELKEALFEASRAVKKETGQAPWMNLEASLDKYYLWRDVGSATAAAIATTTKIPTLEESVASLSKLPTKTPAPAPANGLPGFYLTPVAYIALKPGNEWTWEETTRDLDSLGKPADAAAPKPVAITKSVTETDLDLAKISARLDFVSLTVKADGIYFAESELHRMTTSRKIFAFDLGKPVAVGTSWKNDFKWNDLSVGLRLRDFAGTCAVTKDKERVKVPAGEYEAVVVEGKYTRSGFGTGPEFTETIWVAPTVGIVKWVRKMPLEPVPELLDKKLGGEKKLGGIRPIRADSVYTEIVWELKKFTPAK